MHETVAPLQMGLSVAGSFGVVGVLLAVGELLGRPRRGTRRFRSSPVVGGTSRDHGPTVTDNVAERRFEIRVEGDLAGIAEYWRSDDVVTFHHTEISPHNRGRGLAGTLIKFGLDASRHAGLTVEPRCPYVRAFIEKHNEYSDLLASKGASRETEGCCASPS